MIPEIDVDELARRLDDGAVLVDVREVEEYVEAHVPGAQLVPLSQLRERLDEVPATAQVLLICRSGARSMQAAALLAEAGHDTVNVAGGTMAWMAAGRGIATGMERG